VDTIAAIATSHGVGSIAVIRVSGANSLKIAKKLSKRDTFTPRYATLTPIYDKLNDMIDESIVIYFKAPHSFTAEDIVEFQCHGGLVVANMIMDEVLSNGARLAEPGEFSKRAFLNGKIDLSEAEAIAKLIETKSIDAAKILTRQMKGEIKDFVDSVRENLINILAFVEVNIDYAEEDLPQDLMDQIQKKLEDLRLELRNCYDSSKRREGLIEGFRVSIVGKPNVGKSSLLNSFLNYDRAIISDIAGTTRDTIEEEIYIGTHIIKIVDTAGIREASDTIEKIGIERSLKAVENSDIVIAMFDNSREFDNEDEQIVKMLNEYPKKDIIYVLNKSDLPSKFDTSKIDSNYTSLNCKEGISELASKIKEILDNSSNEDSLLLTSKRQLEAVKKAYESIEESVGLLSEGELELFAFNLNEAIASISSISKNFDRTEILDKMFGSFCLGK
jgi:tRNA modification GTPase